MDFTSLLGTGNPGPRSLNLTNCGGNGSKNWQASVQSSEWLSLSLYSGSLASNERIGIQVQANSSSLGVNIYHGSIVFTAGTSSWRITVTYTIVQA